MKSANFKDLALLFCLLFVLSCTKNTIKANPYTSVKAFSEYLGKPITTNLKGQVLDNNQLPLKKVKVSVGEKSVLTNNDGKFVFKGVTAKENLLTLKVVKNEYKSELINLTPNNDTTTVNITLYKDNELSIFWFSKNNHNLPQTINK